jgi:hypothetical protein
MNNDVQQSVPWSDVAPLLQRWQMALLPQPDGTWDVQPGYPSVGPHRDGGRSWWWRLAVNVPFAELPQAIQEVSRRCEAEKGER